MVKTKLWFHRLPRYTTGLGRRKKRAGYSSPLEPCLVPQGKILTDPPKEREGHPGGRFLPAEVSLPQGMGHETPRAQTGWDRPGFKSQLALRKFWYRL